METKTIKYILILAVFIFFSNATKATDFVKLDIKIVEVHNDKIVCNFRYHFVINQSDSTQIFFCCLPFTYNSRINTSLVASEAELFVTHGFNLLGKGLVNINTFGKSATIDLEFSNVELPTKPSMSDENGLIVTLDFSNKFLPKTRDLIRCILLKEFQISNTVLTNSNPKFKLVEDKTYQLASLETLENVYFVIPKPKESFMSLFFVLMSIAIIIGFASSIKLIQGKTLSIIGLVVGIIALAYLIYLVFSKIVPDNFTKDVSMISLIGGGIGLLGGIVLKSAYNLIQINAIERQQG